MPTSAQTPNDRGRADPEPPGTLIPFGKYLLDEELARGGMARVYAARLRGLGGFEKRLVVKQILPELASDPRFVEMFVQEANTLVQMSHPHIVPVYELGVVDGVYFLAMEHVEGATLAEMLRDGPLPPALATHVAVQLCDALAYSHASFGLVHRDVTPRNVMIDANGNARLLDFGIAARAEGIAEGEVFGSHGYMSPEQARGEAVGPASDLFSLGCVLYEAIRGTPAFLRNSTDETRAALFDGPSPALEGSDAPPELAKIVDDLLMPLAEERPASAQRVGARLRSWLSAARPEGVGPELGDRTDRAQRRRRRTPSTRPPVVHETPTREGVVQTLATSVTLQQLLDPQVGRDANGPISVPTDSSSAGEPGTQPIPGRRSHPEHIAEDEAPNALTATSAGTERVTPAVEQGFVEQGIVEQGIAKRDSVTPWWMIGAAAVAGIVATIGVSAMLAEETAPPVLVATASDAGAPATAGALALDAGPVDEAPLDAGALDAGRSPAAGSTESGTPIEVAETGTVTISASPWASVRVDRRLVGNTPRRRLPLGAGTHTVELDCPPLGTQARVPIRVTPNTHLTVIADMTQDPPTVRVE